MGRRRKLVVAAALLSVVFLVSFVVWLNLPKPPYEHVPFSTENFVDFPSELVIERAKGEFDNYTLALASYISNDEVFLGIKIWNLDYSIDPINDDERFDFHNVEVLAFTRKDDLELRELTLQANVSAKGDYVMMWSPHVYNLELVHFDQNGNSTMFFHGVGYSNRTGFKTDGWYEIIQPSTSLLHELTLTTTLSYARGPFGLYGTNKVLISLEVKIKE